MFALLIQSRWPVVIRTRDEQRVDQNIPEKNKPGKYFFYGFTVTLSGVIRRRGGPESWPRQDEPRRGRAQNPGEDFDATPKRNSGKSLTLFTNFFILVPVIRTGKITNCWPKKVLLAKLARTGFFAFLPLSGHLFSVMLCIRLSFICNILKIFRRQKIQLCNYCSIPFVNAAPRPISPWCS